MNCHDSLPVQDTLRGSALKCAALVVLLAINLPLSAQAVRGPVPQPGANPAPDDEAEPGGQVVLDPFAVTTQRGNDYLASEQATGTRYAVQIRDIPFPVSVVTRDLMKDFQAWNFDDAVAYSSSFSQTSGTGNFILRGIRQSNSGYRNGVRDNGVLGTAFIDRIEIIKGANAAIYGQTEPSGLRNVITLRPRPERRYEARLTVGSESYRRASVSANHGSPEGRVSARIDAYTEVDRLRAARFAENKVSGAYAALEAEVGPRTRWFVSLERTSSDVNDVLPQPILIAPSPAPARPLGVLGVDAVPGFAGFDFVNFAGPDAYNRIESTVVDSILSHRFNDVLSLRWVSAWWLRDQRISSFAGGANVNAVTRTTADQRAAYVDRPIQQNLISQIDLLAEFSLGSTDHKLLVTYDRQAFRIDQTTLGRALTPLMIDQPNYDRPAFVLDRTVYPILQLDQVRHNTTQGVLLSERMSLFAERLHVYAGGRYDEVTVKRQNRFVANPVQVTLPEAEALTFQGGVVGRFTESVSVYGNYSESFFPQAVNTDPRDANGNAFDNQEGLGKEVGVKASAWEGKLSFTLGYFDIEKTQIPRPAFTSAGVPIPVPGSTAQAQVAGDQRSQGWELDAVWRATEALQLTLAYGRNNARWTRDGQPANRTLVGVSPDGSPRENLGAVAGYRVMSGRLKGGSFRTAIRHQGASIYSSAFRDSDQRPILLQHPSFTLVDAGVGFEWRRGRAAHRIDLNVRNVFDRDAYVQRVAQQPRAFFLSYELALR